MLEHNLWKHRKEPFTQWKNGCLIKSQKQNKDDVDAEKKANIKMFALSQPEVDACEVMLQNIGGRPTMNLD